MTDKAPKRLKLWDDLGRNWGCNCSFIFVLKIGVKDTNSKLLMQSVEEFSVLPPSTKTSLQSRRYTRQTLLLWGSVWCSECGCCDLKKENMHNWNISTFSPSPRVTFYLCSSTWLVFFNVLWGAYEMNELSTCARFTTRILCTRKPGAHVERTNFSLTLVPERGFN